jgi:hypothetical protein
MYCSPRKTSSASFSRFTNMRHDGKIIDINMPITAMPASSPAIAYPEVWNTRDITAGSGSSLE